MKTRTIRQVQGMFTIIRWLWMMPLLSLPELEAATGLTYDRCNRLTKLLYRQGKVDHVRLGMTLEVQDRYFLTTSGVRYALDEEVQFTLEWQVTQRGLQLLIGRLPTLEAFYRLAPRIWGHPGVERIAPIRVSPDPDVDELEFPPDLPLKRFQWQLDSNVHAISEYANGAWLPWVWVGPMTKWPTLRERRVNVEVTLARRSSNFRPKVPAGWIIVGSDAFAAVGAETLWRNEDALVITVDGPTRSSLRPREFDPPSYEYPKPPDRLGLPEAVPEWFQTDSALRALNGKLTFGLFAFIAQWPGLRLKHIHRRFSHSHGDINAALKKITNVGLIVALDGAYYLTRDGMLAAARMDRVSHQSIYASFDVYLRPGGNYRRNHQRHDQAVADVVLACERAGHSVCHGRRDVIAVSDKAQVAADAVLVMLRRDGRLRIGHIEVELSAKAPSSARKKLRHYRMFQQSFGYSLNLLMIVGSEAAEEAFLREGRGLAMMVTTLERLLASGPGAKGVWKEPKP